MEIEIYLRNSPAVIRADVESLKKRVNGLGSTINFEWTNAQGAAANRELFYLRVDDVAAIVAVHSEPAGTDA